MAINFSTFERMQRPEPVMYITVMGEASIKEFKELVQRGTNLWPDASPDIKEFADLVTNGKVLQDYRAQIGQLVPAKKMDGVLVEMSPVSLSSIQQP